MATKIETSLSPEELMEFFRRCAQTKGGATGPAIQAIAQEFGVTISHDSANNFRKGPLDEYLKRLEKNTQKTRELVELAKANVPTSRANEVKLGLAISDKLDAELDDMSVDDLDKTSRINARLRSSEDRTIELERRQSETEKKLELADKQLTLRDQKIAELERKRAEWEEQRARATAAVKAAAKKGGLTADTQKLIVKALTEEVVG